jgi:hypothetical protein
MTRLEDRLIRACEAFKIRIDLGFKLPCPDGHDIHSVARIYGVGPPKGMLVVGSFDDVRAYQEFLDLAEFGYSVLDEPGDKSVFDLESYREMFCDWGWPDGECPEPDEEADTE